MKINKLLESKKIKEGISGVEPVVKFQGKSAYTLTKDKKWEVTFDEAGNILARTRHGKPSYFKGHINDKVNDFPSSDEDNIILAAREQHGLKFGKKNEAFEKDGGPFWYFSKHGIGPGMLPKGVNVVDTIEDDNFGTYIALDKVLTTQELRDYELKEKKPPMKEGWAHFEFTSGANPYIAKTKDEVDRIKRSRGDSVRYVGNIDGNDYYTIDDSERDLFSVEESFKPSNSGIQSVKCYNRYNYTIQELRVDNDNKTFERGNFTAGKADKKVKNRQGYEDIVDSLKKLGYEEIPSDYRSLRNKSRKGVPTNESIEKGEPVTLWWKDEKWSKTSPCYASCEYVGKTRDGKHKFISDTYGWVFVVDFEANTVTTPQGKTFELETSSGWANRFNESKPIGESLLGKTVQGTNYYGDPVGKIGKVIKEYPKLKDTYGNYDIDVQYEDGQVKRTRSFWVKVVDDIKESKSIKTFGAKAKKLNEAEGPFYVTVYEETSASGPEEGGYTSYGWEAIRSRKFNSEDRARQYRDEFIEGAEVTNEHGNIVEIVDEFGDRYKVAIETEKDRGSANSPAKSWAQAEMGVEFDKPFFDDEGKRLPEDPKVTAKRKADREALKQEYVNRVNACQTKKDVIKLLSDTKYDSLDDIDGYVSMAMDKYKSLEESKSTKTFGDRSKKLRESADYKVKFFQVFEAPKSPKENGKMIGQRGSLEDANAFGKERVGKGNYIIKAVCDDGKVRNIDNDTKSDAFKMVESVGNTFKVGDTFEYSGLYGGSQKCEVIKVTDDYIECKVTWTSEDDGKEVSDTSKFNLEKDTEGKQCAIVWEYHGEKGRVYPNESMNESKGKTVYKAEYFEPKMGKWIYYYDGTDIEKVKGYLNQPIIGDPKRRIAEYEVSGVRKPKYKFIKGLDEDIDYSQFRDLPDLIPYVPVEDNRKWQYSIGGKDVPYTSYEDAKAHMNDDYKITDYRDELQKYIDSQTPRPQTFFVDETFDDRLVISINWGDWKHEHGYADCLVRSFFRDKGLGIEIDEQVTEEDGSDTYSAEHYYTINDIMLSGRVVESKESDESELITKYLNNGEIDKLEKVQNGTNVIWKLKDNINEASYGGAFDIEDDQFFTRDDINDASEEVLDHINETFTDRFIIGGTWFENGEWIVNIQTEDHMEEYEDTVKVDMRKIRTPMHLKHIYALELAAKIIAKIKEEKYGMNENWADDKLDELSKKPKSEWTQEDYEDYAYCKNANAERDYYDSMGEAIDDDVKDLSYYYDEADIIDALTDVWEEVASKQVEDSVGFMTDYTMYKNINTGEYVFIFGDKDAYRPEDGYFDWECETEEEAQEWFSTYNGFGDIEESYEVDKVFSAACSNRLDYMKKGLEKGKIDPNTRLNRFNNDHSYIMGALRNGNKDMVKLLQDNGGTILDAEQDEFNKRMKGKN